MMDRRGNLLSVAVALASVGGVAVSFPFDAVSFRPQSPGERPVFAANVSLSEKEESAAMKAAKNSWNAEAGSVRSLRAELRFGELPEVEGEPALGIADRLAWPSPAPVEPGLSPYLPSLAAPPPAVIKPDKDGADESPVPAFPREERLKMD